MYSFILEKLCVISGGSRISRRGHQPRIEECIEWHTDSDPSEDLPTWTLIITVYTIVKISMESMSTTLFCP